MTHVDILIIGSGTGNSLVTDEVARRDVAIVERGTFGGTCLNVGCIPTKMLVRPADLAASTREAARLGVDLRVADVRWREIRDRVFGRIDPISEAGRRYRAEGNGARLIEGTARFTGPREVDVDGKRVTADQVVVAVGARSEVPDVLRGIDVHTSDTVMRVDELPRRMVIVGGGYIAAEMAHVFGSLGAHVTVVVRGRTMLRHLDDEVSAEFTRQARQTWDVRLGRTVTAAEQAGGVSRLTLDDGTVLEADLVLAATGRAPATTDLGLDTAGVEVHEDGRIRVDEHGRTTADGVWALGDCASPYQLKHVANAEGRVVAHNLVHPEDLRSFDHAWVPATVFSSPQVASAGLTEAQARERGRDVAVKVQRYGDTAYGWAMEDTTSFAKLVADTRTGELLGAHLIGHEASLLLQPLLLVMERGIPVDEAARGQYWPHPALTEVVENALLGLDVHRGR